MNKKSVSMLIAAVVIAGAIAFWGGMKYESSHAAAAPRSGNFQNGRQFGARMGGQGGFVSGSILSKDAQSITVQLRDGGSRIVFLSGSTKVLKSVEGSASDLAVGSQVVVSGTPNSDGSVAAQSVQLRPDLGRPAP